MLVARVEYGGYEVVEEYEAGLSVAAMVHLYERESGGLFGFVSLSWPSVYLLVFTRLWRRLVVLLFWILSTWRLENICGYVVICRLVVLA